MQTRNFKIVDSFLFSEVYEKELLLLKFILENDGVDEWVLLENAYSFQGEYTGLHAQKMLNEDERFQPYLHKLKIISKEEKTQLLPRHEFLDHLAFQVEYWQRDLAYDYFMENYTANDWIMVSDVDEMIDFTNEARRSELYSKINTADKGLLLVPTKRFWYDFDNEYRLLIGNAMCNKSYLLNTAKKLHHIRRENRKILRKGWKITVQFEYSSCFDTQYILRKHSTQSHMAFTQKDLLQALRCNHRTTISAQNKKPQNNKKYFFRKTLLTDKNSPEYVRQNLSQLKTNIIDTNYKKNRRMDYPELFKSAYFIRAFLSDKKRWLEKKTRFFLRKIRMERFVYK